MSDADSAGRRGVAPTAPAALAVPPPSYVRRQWPTWARALTLGSAAAVTAAVCTRVYLVDPAQPGHYPTCPFFAITGLDCPGCGTARGLHQLLHGHVAAAMDYNVFLVLLGPLLVAVWLVEVARTAGWRGRVPSAPGFVMKAVPVVIALFWVVRNLPIPGATWLAAS